MKLAKRLFGLFLALTLFCALAGTAFAAETTANITIDDTSKAEDNTYVAYKLLNANGAIVGEGEDAEEIYVYTLNHDYEAILKSVTGKTTEADIIEYISELDDAGIRTFADAVYAAIDEADPAIEPEYTTTANNVFSNVAQGYYLIAEIDNCAEDDDADHHPDTVSLVMLDTAGLTDISIKTKEDAPSVVKKVKDIDDSTTDGYTDWQDSADYDIGDTIPYQITGTVSSKIANYNSYKYKFVDTMTHLTYQNDAKVYAVKGEEKIEITSFFTVVWNSDTKVLTLTCKNLKASDKVSAGTEIVVEYTAELDSDAIIGSQGNPNTVYLNYSRNPYTDDTQDTPEDTNIVFTFKGIVNKVDKNGDALQGAGFTLYKFNGTDYVAVGEELKGDAMTKFEYIGLDAGQYKIVETTVPAGYNKAEDIEFKIVAEHEVLSDNPSLTSLVVKNLAGEEISGKDLTFTATASTGEISTKIVNKSGTELPSTGGIGTTIFYIVGGLMVFGAGVLLITRKRMGNAE